ncbi:Hypothetical predicted protein [Lecanosticta acicola]|uniref:Uncharacterized protein n=1 Tax=Lecanosticta acicola TaxID=111012 RepID=A0AAI8Z6N5_9PEZI|nr:Hypothetical predicted protein [Lecanosticta acicola]
MPETYEDLVHQWIGSQGFRDPVEQETAWKRYNHILSPQHQTESEASDPTADSFQTSLSPFLGDETLAPHIFEVKFLTVPCNRIPWQPTDIQLQANQVVSVFTAGRVWFSRLLDMYLRPQAGLFCKIGVDGEVFNSTRDTHTFRVAESGGELFLATQPPGMFANPAGGRLVADLGAYDHVEGRIEMLVVVWKNDTNVQELLSQLDDSKTDASCRSLLKQEKERPQSEELSKIPGWQELWFLGQSTMYRQVDDRGSPCINCKPYQNVGILQKNISPTLNFGPDCVASWRWKFDSIPSRLREDTAMSHDYLSIAFEFESGRDITYHPSWELPLEHGYWCPQATWTDREYHVVIRSGTDYLGEWLSEERNLYDDYAKYIGNARMPKRITRVWLIAGNRWQRHDGEMTVKDISITHDGATARIL